MLVKRVRVATPLSLPAQDPVDRDRRSVAYPQQAVAIGGSTPELPTEIDDLVRPMSAPAEGTAEGTRKLERYQVTGIG